MPKKWIEEKCVFCSLCTVLCPHEVFTQADGKIQWNAARCVNCEECLASIGCPRRAIN
ncbi:MAG: 4Fe-4S binding protein [Candidatus Bathyarchaeia archaeon]